MRAGAALLVVLLAPGCGILTYELSRAEQGTMEPAVRGLHLEVGRTTFPQALTRLGAPDTVRVGWDPTGNPFTRLQYWFQRAQGSNLALRVPRQEVSTYNTGVRFFLIFLGVLRGRSPTPPELRGLLASSPLSPGRPRRYRMSELQKDQSNSGSPERLSRLRTADHEVPEVGEGPVTPLDALVLEGAARGVTVLRLEFDRTGLLRRKEFRVSTPASDAGSQVGGSLLR